MLDTTTNSARYRGGEGQSVFPIPFPFLETGHIRAHVRDAGGGGRALSAGVDYSINRISDANGELVLLGSDLSEGSVLTITRLVPLTQDILFHNQGPNSPRAVEEAADKLTMIAQQLQNGIDHCLPVPDGLSGEEMAETIMGNAARLDEIGGEVRGLEAKVNGKAALAHSHDISGVNGLSLELAEKADLRTITESLAGKANKTQLQAKADLVHLHPMDDVIGLGTALAAKVNVDDPRLDGLSATPPAHAASHAKDGSDPVRPQDIGALGAPPADGKPYLAAAGGWIEYIAPGAGSEGGGTFDHSQLANRNAADQHPQSAIQNLVHDLDEIRDDLYGLDSADRELEALLAAKADASQLPGPATPVRDGLLVAADKRKLDAISDDLSVLPEGGLSGDVLVSSGSGACVWKSPSLLAGTLPMMSESQKGVARLAADGGLELDGGGTLRIAPDSLVSKANIESRLGGLDGRIQTLDTRTATLPDRVDAVAGDVGVLGGRLDALGDMAHAADAPRNDKPHMRQNGAWVEHAGSSGGNGGGIVGEIRLLPFRKAELPDGWYFCNGDKYALSTAQGDALNSLPATMKTDWAITASGGNINLPNLFSGTDGYFLRAVNNSARLPGNKQADAIRNITGSFGLMNNGGAVWISSNTGTSTMAGALKAGPATKAISYTVTTHGYNTTADLLFDASVCVATANENRPMNIGMTPAIYLGV